MGDDRGWVSATLSGWGSASLTSKCMESCAEGFQRVGLPLGSVLGLIDISSGYGVSPLIFPKLLPFVSEHRPKFSSIAVVATGVPLAVSRFVAQAAGFTEQGVP